MAMSCDFSLYLYLLEVYEVYISVAHTRFSPFARKPPCAARKTHETSCGNGIIFESEVLPEYSRARFLAFRSEFVEVTN
jgi:hypothetical protein